LIVDHRAAAATGRSKSGYLESSNACAMPIVITSAAADAKALMVLR